MMESRPVGINRRVAGSSPASGAIFGKKSKGYVLAYILQNPAGQFYIGHTDNLSVRLCSHNRTDEMRGKFTRKNGPWELVWSEEHPTRAAAMLRERQIKGMKSAKWIRDELVNDGVPTRRD